MENRIAIRPVQVTAYRDYLQPGFWVEFRGMDDEGRKYLVEMQCGEAWKRELTDEIAKV